MAANASRILCNKNLSCRYSRRSSHAMIPSSYCNDATAEVLLAVGVDADHA